MDTNVSSVTNNSSSREDLTTKLERIRRNFTGNVYDWDQIDVDGIYELEITRRKIWEHTNIKLKRQLVFIGEPALVNNSDVERFGLIIVLALIYGSPGSRNMPELLVCAFLILSTDNGNIEDIPDFDIQTKLKELSTCADEDTF